MGSWVNLALLAGVAGVYLPWKMGIEFLDPLVIIPYALLSLLYVSAALPRLGASRLGVEGGPHAARPRLGVIRLGVEGMAYAAVVLMLSISSVNLGFWTGKPLLPPLAVCASALMLSFSAAAFAAMTAGGLMATNYSAREAGTRIRGVLFALLGAWFLRNWLLPVAVREWVAPWATTRGLTGLALAASAVLLALTFWGLRGTRSPAAGLC